MKDGTKECISRAAMEEDLWTWGGGRECEMYGNSNMETYITIYIKEIATRNLLYVSGNSNRGSMST